VCKERHGWYGSTNYLTLQTNNKCGESLTDGAQIVTVNGAHLVKEQYMAFVAIKAACDSGGELLFGLADGGALAPMTCDAAIVSPENFSGLADLPKLPQLSKESSAR